MKELTIHETAIVDKGSEVGNGTKIWHWTHVSTGAKVGEKCSIGQNVYIGGAAKVGNRVKIQNNVSIYDAVEIGDNVFCGPSVVFTNVINPRADINRKDEYLNTKIKEGVTLGANSTIVCGVTIGKYAFVGAGAVVTKNVADYALVVGVPAKQIGWMSKRGERIDLPLRGNGEWKCKQTGIIYALEGERIEIIE